MKLKIFLITSLICGGLLLSSCQKDNGVLPAGSESMSITDNSFKSDDKDDRHWQADPMTNYPDPFRNITTIEVKLEKSARVSLVVYHTKYNGLTYLVNGYQRSGIYKYEFDATNLPSGVYIARLKIDNVVVKERMTKIDIQNNQIVLTD